MSIIYIIKRIIKRIEKIKLEIIKNKKEVCKIYTFLFLWHIYPVCRWVKLNKNEQIFEKTIELSDYNDIIKEHTCELKYGLFVQVIL